MPSLSELLRGLGRGLSADVVGAPVDLAEQVTNLGLAGYGYLGHKLGLLKPEEMPKPLSGSVGTSEWFSRGTPLASQKGEGLDYQLGRMSPALVGMAKVPEVQMVAQRAGQALANPVGPSGKAAQRGAIRVGGAPDLVMAHGSDIPGRYGEVPTELYSPSLAITSNQRPGREFLTDFGGGLWLIPRVGAFSPTSMPATIFNRDAYTPRWRDFPGQRVDAIREMKGKEYFHSGDLRDDLAIDAEARLLDRGLAKPHELGQKGFYVPEGARFAEMDPGSTGFAASVKLSPRFQSLAHYETSPMGAATLRNNRDPAFSSEALVQEAVANFGRGGAFDPGEGRRVSSYMTGRQFVRAMSELAKTDPRAGELLRGLAKVPSDYGELKAFGPVQINPENFAGFILRDENNNPQTQIARFQDKWRIPGVEAADTSDNESLWHLANQIGQAAPPKRSNEKGSAFVGMGGKWPIVDKPAPVPPPPPAPSKFDQMLDQLGAQEKNDGEFDADELFGMPEPESQWTLDNIWSHPGNTNHWTLEEAKEVISPKFAADMVASWGKLGEKHPTADFWKQIQTLLFP